MKKLILSLALGVILLTGGHQLSADPGAVGGDLPSTELLAGPGDIGGDSIDLTA